MGIKDITGLEKPLQKLIEVFAEGLGETANAVLKLDAKKIKRIGEAEAEVEKTKIIKKAEANVEVFEIFKRAEKRFALEQYNKQINLENVFVGAKENLEGKEVSDQPVDKDWAFRFMNIAQDISREDMQKILSKILAEEIKKPNTFSLRTLDFIKNLSKPDLFLFKKIALITSHDFIVHLTKGNANEGFFNISYSEIMQMIEIGFVQSSLSTILKLNDVPVDRIYPLVLKNGNYTFKFTEEQKGVTLPVLQLTLIGKEISSLIEIEDGDDKIITKYLQEIEEFWKTKKLELIN
ncbi:MAG TPA: DUF2806 domain-containing protein [Candidatus Paceibacterota bacterium]